MRGFVRYGVLAAAALASGGLLLSRRTAESEAVRTERPARVAPVRGGGGPAAPLPPDAAPSDGSPLAAILAAVASGETGDGRSAELLSGPLLAEGPGEDPGGLAELALTPSQSTVVLALVSDRDARLAEIRGEVAAGTPDARRAELLTARAQEAQASFLASIRGVLLPDQRDRFEALLRSGRWGGYTLVIPIRR